MPAPLPLTAPFDATALLEFLARRAVPGVEEVAGACYRRSVDGAAVGFELRPDAVRCDVPALGRRLIGSDDDVAAAEAQLGSHPRLGPLVRRAPGLRVPGHPYGAELAVRAVLGQQISVARARTLAGRLTAAHGAPLGRPVGATTHAFPTSAALAAIDPETLPMPRARGRALVGLCTALAAGDVDLRPGADPVAARAALLALPGIGPWTADYVLMRALSDPDVLLVGDLGVRHALAALGADVSTRALRRLAAEVSPWGSYATVHLWRGAR